MHEFQYVQELYNKIVRYAEKRNGENITSVTIAITRLSGIEPESFQFYWKLLTKQSTYKKTKLIITRVPTTFMCVVCSNKFISNAYEEQLIHCPVCDSIKTTVIEDTEVTIQQITVDTYEKNNSTQ